MIENAEVMVIKPVCRETKKKKQAHVSNMNGGRMKEQIKKILMN